MVTVRFLRPIADRFFPQFASLYRTLRDERRGKRAAVKTTRWGFRISGNEKMASGEFEPEETALIQRVLEQADTLVNIGANIGYYTLLAKERGKHVVAFEPLPHNVKFLLRNLEINGYGEGTEVYPVALSDRPSVLKIYGGGTGASLLKGWAGTAESFATLVPVSTLDLILSERMGKRRCLVVLDVEGAEYSVLQGAKNFLNGAKRPVWIVEISSTEHQPSGTRVNPHFLATFDVFWDAGYVCYTATGDLRLVEKAEVARVQSTGENSLGTHNFLFLHPSESFLTVDTIRQTAIEGSGVAH